MNGFLLVDKPAEWTSFDVVAKVRGVIARELGVKSKKIKVGHSGTLDPFATGLLILAIGDATKQVQKLTKLDKTYEVEAVLGATSTTGDPEGELKESGVENQESWVPPTSEDVEQAVLSFLGNLEQTPPKYSAIKVAGQRAYKLARQGKKVELEPRQVTIHSIEDIGYRWPKLTFTAEVSSGTYIRTLVEDIGARLGCGAYTLALRRTAVGKFRVQEAIGVDQLNYKLIQNRLQTA